MNSGGTFVKKKQNKKTKPNKKTHTERPSSFPVFVLKLILEAKETKNNLNSKIQRFYLNFLLNMNVFFFFWLLDNVRHECLEAGLRAPKVIGGVQRQLIK